MSAQNPNQPLPPVSNSMGTATNASMPTAAPQQPAPRVPAEQQRVVPPSPEPRPEDALVGGGVQQPGTLDVAPPAQREPGLTSFHGSHMVRDMDQTPKVRE